MLQKTIHIISVIFFTDLFLLQTNKKFPFRQDLKETISKNKYKLLKKAQKCISFWKYPLNCLKFPQHIVILTTASKKVIEIGQLYFNKIWSFVNSGNPDFFCRYLWYLCAVVVNKWSSDRNLLNKDKHKAYDMNKVKWSNITIHY